MSGLTRDGTAEPVSRDQMLTRERGVGEMFIFTVQLTTTSRIGKVDPYYAICCNDHTYIHTYPEVERRAGNSSISLFSCKVKKAIGFGSSDVK